MVLFATVFHLLVIFILILGFIKLSINLYFLSYKLENKPYLIKILDETINNICVDEGIGVFNKSYEEANKDIENESEKIVGKYIYTLDVEHKKKLDSYLEKANDIERRYKINIEEESTIVKENLVIPRILLCKETLLKFGLLYYYSVFLHEIGHHFCVKKTGSKHTELDADLEKLNLVKKYLPNYFLLIFEFDLEHSSKKEVLTKKEKLLALISYFLMRLKNIKITQ